MSSNSLFKNSDYLKFAFSKELTRKLIEFYGRMPSASVVSRDFNLRAENIAPISQETARRWIRSISIPEIEKLQLLVEWLDLDLSFVTQKEFDSSSLERRSGEQRSKKVALDPIEAFLLKSFKETDARGKHCLLSLAKSLHEKPDHSL